MLPAEITTVRLRLTLPGVADVPAMIALANDPVVEEMTLTMPYPYGEADAVAFINRANVSRKEGSAFMYAIRLKGVDEFMGGVGLHIDPKYGYGELGYWMGAPFRGKGYVTEAVGALIDLAFETTGLVRIQAMTRDHNHASGKILLNNGMQREAVMEDHTIKNGEVQTVIQYRILRREWTK
ncbi:RimJ/RimL family protein N-acetyltransferase [Lewinella aquimaris]|uniref:RimJ/RimL family protein N-acetyltransferase n=1 Tax=Neolewinella aquimaris TaxID=1835722 RepID=A0A840DZI1_9BACT|nr:GNAT family protein [Neolewinella aquimaris]MBB4078320.1 RimJ/RimL family protein N-acetyltransferase [Neolewinella aquimaris]